MKSMKTWRRMLRAGALAGVLAWNPAAVDAAPGTVPVALVERPVFDQDGNTFSFAGELIGDRRVVIATMYTTCGTLCPLTSTVMQGVQDELARPGLEDVVLVSITLDPGRDGVDELANMAATYGAGPDWRFVSGDLLDVLLILDGLGAPPGPLEEHPPLFLVGRGDVSEFVRLEGLPAPANIVALLAGFAS